MKKDQTTVSQKAKLEALASLPDEDIKINDIPEVTDWRGAVRGKFYPEAERRRFLEGVNTDFAALRNDPAAWQEEQAERAAWDCTLADGLKDE